MENLAEGIIKTGDVLLLFGAQRRARELQRRSSRLRILGNEDSIESVSVISRNAWKSIGIFFVSILVGTTGLLPLSVAFLSGAVLAILTGCITAEKAREFIDWRLLILIGGMTAFGTAMEKTGAAELLAGWVISVLAPLGVAAVLAGFLVLTILLTQPMSNAAAALVILPVGLSAAKTIGADPRTFAIGIMLAASVSFITPLEPACLLVTSAGKYRMIDFIRIGGLLTVLLTIAILIFLPLFWNLQ
jgi:di/tricarboxylate transporter